MNEFFVVANSNPAPFVGDTSKEFVQGESAREALKKFVRTYSHPFGLHNAEIYASSDAYHKDQRPLASWMTNAALAQSDPNGGQLIDG